MEGVMVSFIIVADHVMSTKQPGGNTSEDGTLSWINMTDSLGIREISCQQNEPHSQETP